MKENPVALTFDVGTQSARALLIDTAGNILHKAQKSYECAYESPHPNWAEQDAEVYWDTMCQMSRQLREISGKLWERIAVVSCTCIRATTLCLDRDRRPLRSAIVWLDKRKAQNLPPLPLKCRVAFKAAGLFKAAETVRANMACNWIAVNQPEIWKKTDKFVLLSSYLNYKLCGELTDSVANTCGVLPFDSKAGRWLKPKALTRSIYLVEDEKLVDLVSPGTVTGKITDEAARLTGIPQGVPYAVTGSDKACETLGLSCSDVSCAALSFGTTATIEVPSPRHFNVVSVIPPYTAIPGGYLPEVETFRGYWLISWFTREFAAKETLEAERLGCSPEELLNERLKEIPAGCDGLVMQPTFTPDPVTPNAKGAVIGFYDAHTRIHLYRAIIEGINYSMMEGLYLIEKKGQFKIKKLFLAGGGSRSSEICQITANMFGLPTYRVQTHEVCGLGCSIAAFVAVGVFSGYPEAIASMVHITDEFLPDMDEHQIYRRLYSEVYCKVFGNLVPLYEKVNHIIGRSDSSPPRL